MTAPVAAAAVGRTAAAGTSASAGRAAAATGTSAGRQAGPSAAPVAADAAAASVPQREKKPAGGQPKKRTGKTVSGELGKKYQQTSDRFASGTAGVIHDGSGFLLALIVWGWVVMPFLEGGSAGVKKVLMAKFLNKAPDGKMLK